ncbi:hypothetical protein [Pelagicoccus albus]|uniref:BNR repeat-like domain-containing protein n=1 Tax=Pelagicoccus albus TaxID=415222 RepID=A0A7X1EA59_9BACT|nr:hypothetical protein [Pelagicoccus albus]MBC2608046.1 hypothetical protein [Pelagicoccus albus]
MKQKSPLTNFAPRKVNPSVSLLAGVALGSLTACAANTDTKEIEPPIAYATEISVSTAADGGLRPAIGTQNIQVYRANRAEPTHLDGLDHTYLHAPMLAYWKGKFHLDYLSAPVNEHDMPTPTSYTSSEDGVNWETPKTLFPSYQRPNGEYTLTHQRSSFYIAPNDKLLATAFHGKYPRPNDGSGIGRVVREIKEDGSFGPIYFIRYNSQEDWDPADAAEYPFYTESKDQAFKDACESLLSNKLMTAQWWEEDRSEDGFYREKGKALSYYHMPDGKVVGIWKNAVTMTTDDEGESWIRTGFAKNIPINSSKYWAEKTKDGDYALVFNPTTRLRHPLAIATSQDGTNFDNLLSVHGELPDQRFPGLYKNMGPQYVRGISEGNGTPPDEDLWLTYSVNKEDIWVSRVPAPVEFAVEKKIFFDDFETSSHNGLPENWNIYRPIWAPTEVIDTDSKQGMALSLSDEDPSDYASVTRVFPKGRSALIRFKLLLEQTDGRLEIDVANAEGLRPVQIAFTEDGKVEARHEGIWKPAGEYEAGKWMDIEIDVNPNKNVDRFQFRINGQEVLYRIAYFTDLARTVERLTIRTGEFRYRGVGGQELPESDYKVKKAIYLIDDVSIEANREPQP